MNFISTLILVQKWFNPILFYTQRVELLGVAIGECTKTSYIGPV